MKLRVKEILKSKGITSKELAAKIGMTETGLAIALGDKGNPPIKRLEEIANILEVDVVDLFQRTIRNEFRCPNCRTEFEIKKRG